MVLTRSKSNSQGTTAAAPAPAKAISPAKRKGQTSATPASKATKTEKASDISAIKNKTAEATATNSTETPAIVAAENNTANPIQAEAPATTETLTSVDTAATGPATLDMLEASAPPAPTAPTAATIPAPVDVPVLSSTAPVVVSTEEPTVHDGAAKPSTLRPYDAVVSDIEGTTCPIAFVKESLFPYVTSNLADFLKKNWSSDEMKEAVEALRIQASPHSACSCSK
ncbi:hypothetical protein BX616_010949 [Lobosporangium transversale]|nr:hypothetical protein BX616_010949 [Lobosporangium transversale]